MSTLPHPVITTIGSALSMARTLRDELQPFSPRGRIPAIVQIHQQQIERALAQAIEHRLGGADELGFVAFAGEQPAKGLEHVGLIVGDQDAGGGLGTNGHGGHVEHVRVGADHKPRATRLRLKG